MLLPLLAVSILSVGIGLATGQARSSGCLAPPLAAPHEDDIASMAAP